MSAQQSDLNEFKTKQSINAMNQGFNVQITPDLYAHNLYKLNFNKINHLFRHDFDINNDKFVAKYYKQYEEANTANKKNMKTNIINKIAQKMINQPTNNNLLHLHDDNQINHDDDIKDGLQNLTDALIQLSE